MSAPALESQWCLVGNIHGVRSPVHETVPSGIKHFSGGTKVYCLPAQWGDGYEKIVVIGKHRGSPSLARLVVPSGIVSNWRAQVVYSPSVLRSIHDWCSGEGHRNWQTREEVEEYAHRLTTIECGPSAA